jgi:hypothetical protein
MIQFHGEPSVANDEDTVDGSPVSPPSSPAVHGFKKNGFYWEIIGLKND